MPAVVGVRLLVRVSGLPPDASLFSLTHFNSHDSDIVPCPPGEHMCASGGGGATKGARMQLLGPDGQAPTPAWVSGGRPPPPADAPIPPQSINRKSTRLNTPHPQK